MILGIWCWIVTRVFSKMSTEDRDTMLDQLEGLDMVLKDEEYRVSKTMIDTSAEHLRHGGRKH